MLQWYFISTSRTSFILQSRALQSSILQACEQYREYQKVIKIINDLEISLIDLNFEFQKNFENPLDLYNQNQLHLNTFGYKKAAELIYGKINELNK